MLGGAAVLGGLAFAAAGAQGLGNSLSPFPVPARDNALVTDGVYGMVRLCLHCAALQAPRPVTTRATDAKNTA